jgi:hypothetical protein
MTFRFIDPGVLPIMVSSADAVVIVSLTGRSFSCFASRGLPNQSATFKRR